MYKKSAKFIYILSDYIRCIVEKNSNLRELLLKEFFKNKKKKGIIRLVLEKIKIEQKLSWKIQIHPFAHLQLNVRDLS